jgi:hypothetical protein
MTAHGKLNLLAIVGMPAAASLAALIVFGPRIDTLAAVYGLNLVPMLLGGLFAGLLLRSTRKAGGIGSGIALWPSLIPGIVGTVWYLWRAVLPEEVAPGREYIAAPQYLLILVIVLGIVAWIGCGIARARGKAAA